MELCGSAGEGRQSSFDHRLGNLYLHPIGKAEPKLHCSRTSATPKRAHSEQIDAEDGVLFSSACSLHCKERFRIEGTAAEYQLGQSWQFHFKRLLWTDFTDLRCWQAFHI